MDIFNELLTEARNDGTYFIEGDKIEFSIIINTLMQDLGVSKTELAKRVGSAPAYISRLLRGDANPTLETMTRVANALGVNSVFALKAQTVPRTFYFETYASGAGSFATPKSTEISFYVKQKENKILIASTATLTSPTSPMITGAESYGRAETNTAPKNI